MNRQPSPEQLQLVDLLYQALETELGGVEIYKMAVVCAKNPELKEEWTKYLAQTKRHVEIMHGVLKAAKLDPDATTPGRLIVREKGQMLLCAMQRALKDAPQSAEIVAAECVVDAETKDHKNWELLGAVREKLTGDLKQVISEAYDAVEDEEDEHLYHTQGWCRELSLQALGLPAVLPPPEEEKKVKTAMGAARAKQERKESLKAH